MMSDWACCSGLEMYRYEFAGLLMHAEHLEADARRRTAHDQRAACQTCR